ncbi:DNA replication/repair protein RecF [Aliidiomarina sp. Khilg15.8]
MRLERLYLEKFRNFSMTQLELSPQVNLICGDNGSGKTSLLEAIYCLGFGRSFRTHQVRQMVQDDEEAFTLFALLATQNADEETEQHRVGYRRFRSGDAQVKVDGEVVKRFARLARLVPVQLITPESVELVTGGPKLRRQYMDWGLFHVEQSFFADWAGYVRLLRQRNSLLRQGQYDRQGGAYWDNQLVAAGERVATARDAYVSGLNDLLNEYCHRFLPQYDFKFKLNHGWARAEQSFAEALSQRLEQDKKHGFTGVGPHKAEWQIRADSVDARERLSRGQLKLLVAALRLVQGQDYQNHRGESCIYLVDDLPAELDEENQGKLCSALKDSGSQVFITAIDESKIKSHFSDTESQLFHVEHGAI